MHETSSFNVDLDMPTLVQEIGVGVTVTLKRHQQVMIRMQSMKLVIMLACWIGGVRFVSLVLTSDPKERTDG